MPSFVPGLKTLLAVAGFVVALVLIVFFFRNGNSSERSEALTTLDPSIAVLPFEDVSTAKDQEYFGDGVSEELLHLLGKLPDLKVIARTSAFSFKGKNDDIQSIAKKLGVAYVLEGTVWKDGESVRVTAKLVNAESGIPAWTETYDRSMENLFKLQDEIAAAVGEELKVKLTNIKETPARESQPDVYNLWLKGRYVLNQQGVNKLDSAEKLFALGLAQDPTDARIVAALALLNYHRLSYVEFTDQDSLLHKALLLAQKAVTLDPNLAEAYRILGSCLTVSLRQKEAETALQRAHLLEPNNAAVMNSMGRLFLDMGKPKDAERILVQAMRVEPLWYPPHINYAVALVVTDQYNKALQYGRKALRLAPDNEAVMVDLSIIYTLTQRVDSALVTANAITDEFWSHYVRALALNAGNDKAKSDAELQEFIKKYHEEAAFQIAEMYGQRHERDQMIKWLEVAAKDELGLIDLGTSPFLKGYLLDPRVQIIRRGWERDHRKKS